MDKFFTAQNNMQAQQVQQADITFTGIVQNTVGLGDVLKAELPEIAQFEKVRIYENKNNNMSRKVTHTADFPIFKTISNKWYANYIA